MPKRKQAPLHILNINLEKEVVVLSDFSLCRIYEWLDETGEYCDKKDADMVIFVTPWKSIHTATIDDVCNQLH